MIPLTRLNHVRLVVNSDLIEHIEVTPDTVVALTTGQKFLVLESAEEIVERIVQFRRRLSCGAAVEAGEVVPGNPGSGVHDSDE